MIIRISDLIYTNLKLFLDIIQEKSFLLHTTGKLCLTQGELITALMLKKNRKARNIYNHICVAKIKMIKRKD